jgi:dTDP-4-amino-4,6-dideoxygalactose transaminase
MPASEEAARSTMFLPIFPGLTEEQQERIIRSLEECLVSCRSRETVV